ARLLSFPPVVRFALPAGRIARYTRYCPSRKWASRDGTPFALLPRPAPNAEVDMSNQDQLSAPADEAPSTSALDSLGEHLWPALRILVVLTFLTGVLFPQALAAIAWAVFPSQASGSLVVRDDKIVGSELIGQAFSGPGYFSPRPSAVNHDAKTSGGTNLGPNSPTFKDDVRKLAAEYRKRNGLAPDALVPSDAVTRSGSGLDPHISPANAELQLSRVARERGLAEDDMRRLVAQHTHGRQFGFLGEPRVAVLPLNLALDDVAPLPSNR